MEVRELVVLRKNFWLVHFFCLFFKLTWLPTEYSVHIDYPIKIFISIVRKVKGNDIHSCLTARTTDMSYHQSKENPHKASFDPI